MNKILSSLLVALFCFVEVCFGASTPTCYDTADTVFMLHFDGSNGSTTFTDDLGKTWTANGNAQLTTTSPKFGTAAGTFDGTGDYISTPDDASFDLSGDFTLEFWVLTTDDTVFQELFGSSLGTTDYLDLYYDRGGGGQYIFDMEGTSVFSGAWNLVNSTWHHVAIVKNGSNVTFYFDGVASATSPHTNSSSQVLDGSVWIGKTNDALGQWLGKIDEARLVKTAVWTAGFTPPSSAYTPCSTRKQFALTGVG